MQTNSSRRKSAEIRDWPIVSWWIRVTSPAPGSPAYGRNPQWREEVASLLFPVVLLQVLLPMTTAISRPINLIILLVVFAIDVGALLLKRSGKTYIAGTIIVITTELGLCSALLGGPLNITKLGLFDALVYSTIITMAFFPPITVFLICTLNCIFIFGTLQFFPHVVSLNEVLIQDFGTIALNSIQLQIFVAGVSFIIIRALIKQIRRADTAEELAQLKQSEAELRRREIQQAQQIEEGIQLILQALNAAAAKGDFSMRVPLAQENILWRVGYSINNLLARLQGFKQEKAELDKTRAVANQLSEYLRRGQSFPLNQWTGTSLDQVIIELNKHLSGSAKPSDEPPDRSSQHYFSSSHKS